MLGVPFAAQIRFVAATSSPIFAVAKCVVTSSFLLNEQQLSRLEAHSGGPKSAPLAGAAKGLLNRRL
jgi:hypothetical protein